MKKISYVGLLATIIMASLALTVSAAPYWDMNPKGFEHGLAVNIEGTDYYFLGPGSIEGEIDVPGHTWRQTGPYRVVGRHYNVGPWFMPSGTQWWSSDADYGALLYKVDGLIDVPPDQISLEREIWLKTHGYVHVHEFVGTESWVVYFKHTAVTSFTLDGGPLQPDPPYEHYVTPGIDYGFPNNWGPLP
jgi:hypothetical protein